MISYDYLTAFRHVEYGTEDYWALKSKVDKPFFIGVGILALTQALSSIHAMFSTAKEMCWIAQRLLLVPFSLFIKLVQCSFETCLFRTATIITWSEVLLLPAFSKTLI